MATSALIQRPTLGPIEPQVLYPLAELQARSGLGAAAMRTARRQGLAVRYFGGRAFLFGQHFIEHVLKHGKLEK